MKLFSIGEPDLQFAQAPYPCPRAGITRYSVYDSLQQSRRERIHVGAVGNSEGLDKLNRWLEVCSKDIPGKSGAAHPNLFPAFCGFNRESGFKAEFLLSREIVRQLANTDLKEVNRVGLWDQRVERAVELYYREIKFLVQNRTVDVIVCVLPDSLYSKVSVEEDAVSEEESSDTERFGEEPPEGDDEEQEELIELEVNFRRMLKARTMFLDRVPGRGVRVVSLGSVGLVLS